MEYFWADGPQTPNSISMSDNLWRPRFTNTKKKHKSGEKKQSPKRFEFHLMYSRHINRKEGLSTYREYLIMY